MVVLSRPRSSHKMSVPKISVPLPLNLPVLRKDQDRLDSSGAGSGSAGGGVSGTGTRPGSSGKGWVKPGTAVILQEKEGVALSDHGRNNAGDHNVDGVSKGSGAVYMPPSLRSGSVGPVPAASTLSEKATVLRGEDFPSLQAAVPGSAGNDKKRTDGFNQKQKQLMNGQVVNNDTNGGSSRLNSTVDMGSEVQLQHSGGSRLSENWFGSRSLPGSGGLQGSKQVKRQDDYNPSPLPLVSLNPRSDWADDERDTGYGFKERNRDHGFSKSEPFWERDFDMPRNTVLPHRPVHNTPDRWGHRENEVGKVSLREDAKDSFGRDNRVPSREGRGGNSWRASSPLQNDGFKAPVTGNDRSGINATQYNMNRESKKESNFVPSPYRDSAQDSRREFGSGQGVRQPWSSTVQSYNVQRADRNPRERYGCEQEYNQFKRDTFQSSSLSKSSFSDSTKRFPVNYIKLELSFNNLYHITQKIIKFDADKEITVNDIY